MSKKRFKNKPKKEEKSSKKSGMFSDIDTLEKFIAALSMYYKQDTALEYGHSYFEPQDNLFGEMFDNAVRIKFLRKEHPEFDKQVNHDELKAEMKEKFINECKEQGIELEKLDEDEVD